MAPKTISASFIDLIRFLGKIVMSELFIPIILSQGICFMKKNILIIGGTNEGNSLANLLKSININYTISFAGRVKFIKNNSLNSRIGGFGGASKLSEWIIKNKISHVVDASHPFASVISLNVFNACISKNIPLIRLTRKSWEQTKNDKWINVNDYEEAANLLEREKKRVFLSIGRLNLNKFEICKQNFFLLRVVEELKETPSFPNYFTLVSKGPFNLSQEIDLLNKFQINIIISKNSGGKATKAKIEAARVLNLPVIMIARPNLPNIKEVFTIEDTFKWINS